MSLLHRAVREKDDADITCRRRTCIRPAAQRNKGRGSGKDNEATGKRKTDTWSHQHWNAIVVSINRRSIPAVDWSIVAWSKVNDENEPEDIPRIFKGFIRNFSLPSHLDATSEIGRILSRILSCTKLEIRDGRRITFYAEKY